MRDFNESDTYIQHMLAEHRRLHRLLQSVRHAIAAPDIERDEAWGHQVALKLCPLRDELAHHFLDEEEGGCLEEAVSFCPQVGRDVDRIKNEHPALLRTLDTLIEMAEHGPHTRQSLCELRTGFDNLCRQLQSHEATENALLRRGFGVNVNGDEPDRSTKYESEID